MARRQSRPTSDAPQSDAPFDPLAAAAVAVVDPDQEAVADEAAELDDAAEDSATIEDDGTTQAPNEAAGDGVVEPAAEVLPPIADIAITVPLGTDCAGYAPDSIDFRGMTDRQRAGLYRGFVAVGRENKRFEVRGVSHPDGKGVNNVGDFIRWLGEQLADQYEAQTGASVTEGLVFRG